MKNICCKSVLVTLVLCVTVSLSASPGVIHRAKHPIKGSYIVVLDEHDSVRPAVRAAELGTAFKGKITAVWESAIHGFAIELSESQALALSHSPFVRTIEEDGYGSILGSQPVDSRHWGLDRIDQRNLPRDGMYNYCQDGTGVKIYIVDTGVWRSHDEFDLLTGGGSRVETGMTFCTGSACTGTASSPCNAGGPPDVVNSAILRDHGTMVASVAGGITHGVAKNATIVPVRAGNCQGIFANSWVISAVNWVDAQHQPGEPAVMNCSFKIDKNSNNADAVSLAIEGVINDGVIVVVGAGNTNEPAGNTLLPNIERAITAAASDGYDARWTTSSTTEGSNYGAKVDVFAPGKNIRVAMIDAFDAVGSKDGTSFSAPFVSGVIAQYLQVHPTATPEEVFAWVVASATPNVLTNLGGGSPNRLLYSVCN